MLFILDQLVQQGIINNDIAFEKLTKLRNCNPRLPRSEVEKRLKLWKE
ncbi:hypothetical protein EYV94_12030 [Puteibacter caeruleilacunae]|nr:hypothetical protein EYV94_12030 [Puteibacter caeruleilacunae]